ncbi:MAG: bifunctional nuclease family protein [Capsulimonadaceae bacterium]
MAGDFDKLFGDDWQPNEPESLRRRGEDTGEPGSFEAFPAVPSDHDFTSEVENRTPRTLNEKEVKVMNVYAHQEPGMAPQHFVLLRDNRGRRITIYVGQFEALAIHLAKEGDPPERPLTHDLIHTIIERLNATVDRVIIDDLWNDTFYAKITLMKTDGTTADIDARSSDAIAVAIRAHAPIYMAEAVIEATVLGG